MRHGYKHTLVAIGVSLITLSPTAGVTVYASREQRDLEKSHGVTLKSLKTKEGRAYALKRFDWEGFFFPFLIVGPFAAIEIWLKYRLLAYLIGQHFP